MSCEPAASAAADLDMTSAAKAGITVVFWGSAMPSAEPFGECEIWQRSVTQVLGLHAWTPCLLQQDGQSALQPPLHPLLSHSPALQFRACVKHN